MRPTHRARRSSARRLLPPVLAFAVAASGAALAGPASAATSDAAVPKGVPSAGAAKAKVKDTLGAHDRDLLAAAQAKGTKTVTVMIVTGRGKTKGVAGQIRKLGGFVGKTDDKLGYVRATLPTSKVTAAAALSDVAAVDLNETYTLGDPAPAGAGTAAAPAAGPGKDTPASNPYMPTNETGAVAFTQANPRFDGRGTTIGILDSGVDLGHPALTTTSTGQRKIVDWVTATDPLLEGDATWRAMLTQVKGPSFDYAGQTWKAFPGTFFVNRFSESITAGSEPGGDVNRDGDTTDVFGVLYRASDHAIWVDTDQDGDFTDEALMRPYKERYQVNHFGTDDPATAVSERMPFVVEYREDVDLTPAGLPGRTADFVNIGIVEAAHGSHVAGIAAGHSLFGGEMDGAAPGARIVSSRACSWGGGCTAVALTEGMIDLVANRGVDIVNMSIGGLPALNDANNSRAMLYDRLIEDFGVQIFISAGNSGPGINTVGDPSVATKVVSVAASISKATWKANYGSVAKAPMALFNFSSRGPREDGGFKPNIAAPGSAISAIPTWQEGAAVPEAGYALPPGYGMLNGTSMASPQAAGDAALLLSAAYARGIATTPAQLRSAMLSTAKPIDGVPAYAQGTGLVDVPAAWQLLQARVGTPREFTVSAPVCSPLSGFLATPDRGTGVYNRCAFGEGGQRAGETRNYPVTITRTTGPAGAVTHDLSWIGNDGTWSGPSTLTLRRNAPVTIQVTARPTSFGAHGAILVLDDPATKGKDAFVLNTVVAAQRLQEPSFGWTTKGSVARNLSKSYFVTVPEGTKALQVNLSGIATRSQVRFIGINPYGLPSESTASTACYTNYSDTRACNPNVRTYTDPIPGVWEFEVESRRTSPFLDNPFTLSAQLQGVTVDPETVTLPSVKVGEPTPVEWTVRNTYGPITVTPAGGPLGSAEVARPTIADGESLSYTVDVPAGASRLDVAIGNTSDAGADLDLFVEFGGATVGQSADGDSEESVSIANPAAGTYTVTVDGYAVPAGTTEFDYRDVFYSAALGSVSVPSTPITLGAGESATLAGTVTAAAVPPAGRSLFGEVTLSTSFTTGGGAVVGRGSVVIGEVTP